MVKKIDPKWWLSRMHRDRPGEPGWQEGPIIEVNQGNLNVISKEEHAERVSIIMQALRLAKEMGMIEFDEPKAIDVTPGKD
jgi:hypothetical protein